MKYLTYISVIVNLLLVVCLNAGQIIREAYFIFTITYLQFDIL
jgi:hypothetical protein